MLTKYPFTFLQKIILFITLGFLSFSGCTYKAQTTPKKDLSDYSKKSFNLYSVKSEISMGNRLMAGHQKTLEKQKIAVNPKESKALLKRANAIAKRLAPHTDLPNLPYEVHYFKADKIVNAYCLPGGKMGVFSGLFDPKKGLVNPKDDDELAAILAHEMAHAALRHGTRKVSKTQGLGVLGMVVRAGISKTAGSAYAEIFEQAVGIGFDFYLPSYSRRFEREADQAGLYYMSRAGYNPKAAIRLWKRAAQRNSKKEKKTSVFASHPPSGERYKRLEYWLPQAQSYYEAAKKK